MILRVEINTFTLCLANNGSIECVNKMIYYIKYLEKKHGKQECDVPTYQMLRKEIVKFEKI